MAKEIFGALVVFQLFFRRARRRGSTAGGTPAATIAARWTRQIGLLVLSSMRVKQGAQMKAPQGATDFRQYFAEAKLISSSRQQQAGNYPNSNEIEWPKNGLNRDKPGYSGIKSKLIFCHDFQRQNLPSGIGRQNFP